MFNKVDLPLPLRPRSASDLPEGSAMVSPELKILFAEDVVFLVEGLRWTPEAEQAVEILERLKTLLIPRLLRRGVLHPQRVEPGPCLEDPRADVLHRGIHLGHERLLLRLDLSFLLRARADRSERLIDGSEFAHELELPLQCRLAGGGVGVRRGSGLGGGNGVAAVVELARMTGIDTPAIDSIYALTKLLDEIKTNPDRYFNFSIF